MQLKTRLILIVVVNLMFDTLETCGLNDECIADMRSLHQIINRHVGNTSDDSADVCQRCPGVPGKRGANGIRGFPGERGPKGNTGTCSCDLRVFRGFDVKLKEVEDFLTKVKQNTDVCYAGIKSGRIPLNRVTASSTHSTCPMSGVPLNSGGVWCAETNSQQQWIQVDLSTSKPIAGVATQGTPSNDQLVESYKISYGNNTGQMTYYKESGSTKVFAANFDRSTIVANKFSTPVTARYFRLHPVTYRGWMSLRLELLEC